jgi:hypothetical protein
MRTNFKKIFVNMFVPFGRCACVEPEPISAIEAHGMSVAFCAEKLRGKSTGFSPCFFFSFISNHRLKFSRPVIVEIMRLFLHVQTERTLGFKSFDDTLHRLLCSLPFDLAEYASATKVATETFQTLSAKACACIEVLCSGVAAESMRQVQRCEKDKLLYTSALHLELIRSTSSANSTPEIFDRNLVQLRSKISLVVADVNEAIDVLLLEIAESSSTE